MLVFAVIVGNEGFGGLCEIDIHFVKEKVDPARDVKTRHISNFRVATACFNSAVLSDLALVQATTGYKYIIERSP